MSGVKVILSLAFSKERVESMKVLMLNGSAKKEGNTYQSLLEVGKELERQGIEYEIFQIGSQPVRDCIGCGQCNENGCVFADDKVNEFVAKAKQTDLFLVPLYIMHIQVDGSCHFWTEYFTAAAEHLPSNRRLL